jgi:hypothetical protein
VSVSGFHRYPIADRDRPWDGDAAERRVRQATGATDGPTAAYRDAHLWHDGDLPHQFTRYKLLIVDDVDGTLTVVPRAVEAAAGIVDGARGGLDVPESDKRELREVLGRYYATMGDTAPWDQ